MKAAVWFYILVVVFGAAQTGSSDERQTGLRKTDPISRYFLAPFADDFIRPEALGLTVEEVSIRNQSGETLRGWWLPASDARQTVMFCMGNTGNISSMLGYALILHRGGFNVLLFDYQGFGRSTGIATALSLPGDAVSAFDYLTKERGIAPKDIGIFGVSLGSVLAITVAAERQPGAVAVEDVFVPNDHVEAMKGQLGNDLAMKIAVAGLQSVILPRVDPLRNAARLQCPMLLMHGEYDWLLPPRGTLKVAPSATGIARVWIMKGAGHAPETLEVNDQEYAHQLNAFFHEAFSGSVKVPQVTTEVLSGDAEYVVRVSVRDEAGGGAVQFAFASDDGRFHFINRRIGTDESFEIDLPFRPMAAYAVKFAHVQDATSSTKEWSPALSVLSSDLARYRDLEKRFTTELLEARIQRRRKAVAAGQKLAPGGWNAGDWEWLKTKLPAPNSVHERVRPRYARLIARFWNGIHPDLKTERLQAMELMVQYLPEKPAEYFELNNAEFFLGFMDFYVARALVDLSRHHIALGDPAKSRAILKRWYEIRLPGEGSPDVTPEKIESVSSADDVNRLLSE